MPEGGAAAGARAGQGFAARAWRRYRRSRIGMAGLGLVVLLLVVALLAPVLANEHEHPLLCRYDGQVHAPALKELVWVLPGGRKLLPKSRPFNQVTFDFWRSMDPERGDWAVPTPIRHSPLRTSTRVLEPPSSRHLLGTDEVGRDVLARMVHGARVSMMVGFLSTSIAALIGLFMGAAAGFFGGVIDLAVSRLIEVVICFPTLFLILSMMAWFKPSIWNVMIVIGLTAWTGIARYVRGEFIRLRESDFSVAARALGAGPGRIMARHVLPNALAPVFVPVTFGVASAILIEAGLSWPGFGVQPPQPSWGNILRTAFENIFTAPHLVVPPYVAIFVAVLAYNLVGDTLRDAVDPRLARR